MCGYVHVSAGANRGQERASDPQNLELKVTPRWVPGAELIQCAWASYHVHTEEEFWGSKLQLWATAAFVLETCRCNLEMTDLSFRKLWFVKWYEWIERDSLYWDSPWKQPQGWECAGGLFCSGQTLRSFLTCPARKDNAKPAKSKLVSPHSGDSQQQQGWHTLPFSLQLFADVSSEQLFQW